MSQPAFAERRKNNAVVATIAAHSYEGHWFWIDKSDFRSKCTSTDLLVLVA